MITSREGAGVVKQLVVKDRGCFRRNIPKDASTDESVANVALRAARRTAGRDDIARRVAA